MFSYSYNHPGASMSRLDELLNRNELIYQNLKQKLDGINKSNQNIYRNISHIQTSYSHDPFSQESSAIEREPTIKNTSIRNEHDSPPRNINTHIYPPLGSIAQHQEVTFSQEHNLETEEEIRSRRSRRILEEQQRLFQLELMLEREKMLEEQKLVELEAARYEREETERLARREERQRQAIRDRIERERLQTHKLQQGERRRQQEAAQVLPQSGSSADPSDNPRKSFSFQKDTPKGSVKNNSIYLSKIPKTSLIQADEEIPTFRQSFSKKKEHTTQQQQLNKSEPSNRKDRLQQPKNEKQEKYGYKGRQSESKGGSQGYKGKQLRELKDHSTYKNNRIEQKSKSPQSIKQLAQLLSLGQNGNKPEQDPYLNLQNTIAYSQPRQQYPTPYSELNSHFKIKLEQIQTIPHCILFAPFNKVYRSPILQLKPGCLILQRKSKTSSLAAMGSRTRIVDGLRYKFKTVMTDEQQLLKQLFCSEDSLNFQKRESNKIAIVGGQQSLKKKLHMGLLAYYHQQITIDISSTHTAILVTMEHQTITPNEEPFLLQTTIEADPTSRRLALMKLDKMVNDFHEVIKKLYPGKGGRKVLRMTRLAVGDGKGDPFWSSSIISSNRFDYDFLRHLRVNKIVWSINPLVKHYDEVKDTLQSMRYYIANRRTT